MSEHRDRSSRDHEPRREPLPYFVTAARGTEGLLKAELRALGVRPIQGDRGGVHFGGGRDAAFHVCLWSRIGVRVLERRFEARVRSDRQLYEAVYDHNVSDLLEPSRTLAVSALIKNSYADHSQFVARRVKDAIVDRQRDELGQRSDVNADDPDVSFLVRLNGEVLSFYVDLSGEPLHRRGYRGSGGTAPIKENLAAALLRLAEYDGDLPLCDPCCGSGTILCEAWMMAHRIAPGLGRKRFGLERHVRAGAAEARMFSEAREAARAQATTEPLGPLSGFDLDLDALDRAKQSLRRLGGKASLARRDVLQAPPLDGPGFVVTNPPYGVRLSGGEPFDRRLASVLRTWKGHRIVVITENHRFGDYFGERPAFEHALMNGDLDCRAFGWDLTTAS